MPVTINGDGLIEVGGTSTTQGRVRLSEDTDNGSNYVELTAPASVTANRTVTFPDVDGTVLTTGAVVTVAQGGTGATSLTANNVLLGNGTSAVQVVAPGANGNVLTSNGTTWTSASAPATTISNDTTTNATRYLTFTSATSGTVSTLNVSSTKLTYNPSTGALSSTTVAGSSDERLKKNWRDLPQDLIEQLAKVKAGIYDRTDHDAPVTQVGVSAQSLQMALPNAVISDNDGMLSVAYGNAALVAAIKLAERVLILEKRIAALEAAKG